MSVRGPRAREAAEKMLKQGFVVVRACTENWWDLKARQPQLFEQNVYSTEPTARQQQLICTLNMTQVTVPLAEKLQVLLKEEDWVLTQHTVTRWKLQHGIYLYLPAKDQEEACAVVVKKDVFAVTESSSRVADNLTPLGLCRVFCYYQTPVVWVGFNQKEH